MKLKKTPSLALTLAALTLALTACAPKHAINANAVAEPLRSVSERHDDYVNGDASLSDVQRSIYLRDTELLNAIVDESLSEN